MSKFREMLRKSRDFCLPRTAVQEVIHQDPPPMQHIVINENTHGHILRLLHAGNFPAAKQAQEGVVH